MFKRVGLLLAIFCLMIWSLAFADMSDEATLGGIDSSGNYRWRVDSSGNLKPGTTGVNDIGGSSNRGNNTWMSGNLYFKSTLFAAGVGASGATTFPTNIPATSNVKSYTIGYANVCTHTITLENGYAGQIFSIVAAPLTDTGTLTITASTKTAWSSVSMDTVGDSVTFLYVDDTYGWIVIGYVGVTVS